MSKGAAFFPLDPPVATRDFYFMMLPKMTMLAFSAAVEPLRIANRYLRDMDFQPHKPWREVKGLEGASDDALDLLRTATAAPADPPV